MKFTFDKLAPGQVLVEGDLESDDDVVVAEVEGDSIEIGSYHRFGGQRFLRTAGTHPGGPIRLTAAGVQRIADALEGHP